MRIRLRYIPLALLDQLPPQRLLRNILNGNLKGLFHPRAHTTEAGSPKVRYGSKASAERAASKMAIKRGVVFSNYCCPYCGGYHLGKKRS